MKIIRNGKIVRLAAGGEVRAGRANAQRVGGGVNLAKLKRIKVNQGEIFFKNEGTRTTPVGCPPSWRNSWPQSACCAGKVRRSATDSTSDGFMGVNGT